MIDGIRGTTNWSGGAWQGYQGQDLVAVIDLGKIQNVSKLGAGFLQDVGSWIWMPRSVDFELSLDGRNFVPALTIPNDVPDGSGPGGGTGAIIKDFVKEIPSAEGSLRPDPRPQLRKDTRLASRPGRRRLDLC